MVMMTSPRAVPGRTLKIVVVAVLVSLVCVGVLYIAVRGDNATQPNAGAPAEGGSPPQPVGQQGGWRLTFSDEFDGTRIDTGRWTDRSSALADDGQGNKGNKQLEWNQLANCRVGDGELAMTASREPITSPSGVQYDWTSCLLSSSPSYAFRYGYIEERAILPAAKGFWPAFWTWQSPGVDRTIETDVYEFYSHNHRQLLLTQHSGSRGGCQWRPSFDATADWHVYAAAIEPSGTTWYVNGRRVCHTASTSDGPTNITSNLAVYATVRPAAETGTAIKRVDYVRAWETL
jgi:beta-glucanase (GH16 family)